MAAVPSDELVLIGWLKTLPGLTASAISTTLPDKDTWFSTGYVVATGVGGSIPADVPVYMSVVSVDTWGTSPKGDQPNWKVASTLAERISSACYETDYPGLVTLPAGYVPVVLHSVYPIVRPRKIPNDRAQFARINAEYAVHWTMQEFPS